LGFKKTKQLRGREKGGGESKGRRPSEIRGQEKEAQTWEFEAGPSFHQNSNGHKKREGRAKTNKQHTKQKPKKKKKQKRER